MGYFNSKFILLIILIGLPWNAMVIGIILRKKLYPQPSLMLMLNLAIANFFILLCNGPLNIAVIIGHQFMGLGEYYAAVCETGIFITLFALVSTTTIALMSVDRVIYLKKPLTYHLIVTPWRMLAAIAVTWMLCLALVFPILSFETLILHRLSLDSCASLTSNIWVVKLIVADFTVTTLVQFVGCGCIVFITRTHLREKLNRALSISSVRNGETHTYDQSRRIDRGSAVLKNYSKVQLSLVFVLGGIFVTSLLSLIPLAAIITVSAIVAYYPPPYIFATVYILYLSRAAINPILEVSLTHEIRTALCKLCTAGVIRSSIILQC